MKFIQLLSICIALVFSACSQKNTPLTEVEQWGMYEISLPCQYIGNPFTEVNLTATFTQADQQMSVAGFYDGNGVFKVRFMPDKTGDWSYSTQSNVPELQGKTGSFTCVKATENNHGPVRVANTYFMEYADGTPYYQIGTTCYAWTHQGDSLEEVTLNTLKSSSFNKLRMCIFPKSYVHNFNEPEFYVFERDSAGKNDYSRFNPAYFQHLEKRLKQLQDMNIEADIILLHPYDRWGYATMPDTTDAFYLKYVMARLSAYRNVWWSMANEFDFMSDKNMDDWHRIFQVVCANDPYNHLRSIHNGFVLYNHALPWVTHASIQSTHFDSARVWSQRFKKPLIYDECRYEGDIDQGWGNMSAQEMAAMFWRGLITASYVGHGETYNHPSDILWWAKGGVLHGQSPERIQFFKNYFQQIPLKRFAPIDELSAGVEGELYWYYFGDKTPKEYTFKLPAHQRYRVEMIDTWNMTTDTLDGLYEGTFTLPFPDKKYMAVRIIAAGFTFPIGKADITIDGQNYSDTKSKVLIWNEASAKLFHPFCKEIRYTLDGSLPTKTSNLYTTPVSINKSITLTVVAFDGDKTGEPVRAEIVSESLAPALTLANLQPGLKYSYYTGNWKALPDFSRLKPVKTGIAQRIDLSMIEHSDYFGLVYSGYIKVPEEGVYTFYTVSDDGTILLINGKKIVDNDLIHGTKEAKGQVALAAGYHQFEVHYFDNWYDHSIKVNFATKNLSCREVSSTMLFHD